MGYDFQGFFTLDIEAALTAEERWPFCRVREVTDRMQGFVVRCPSRYDVSHELPNREYEEALSDAVVQAGDVEEQLPDFSRAFPKTSFSFLDMDCLGGACCYRGYSLQNGEKIIVFEEYELSEDVFEAIMEPMGLSPRKSAAFAPLGRGYYR